MYRCNCANDLPDVFRTRLHCTGFTGHDIFVCCPGATLNNKGLLFRERQYASAYYYLYKCLGYFIDC